MTGRKNCLLTLFLVCATSLISACLTILLVSRHDSREQFRMLNIVCGKVLEQAPDARAGVCAALKDYVSEASVSAHAMAEEDILSSLGYCPSDFALPTQTSSTFPAAAGLLTGILLFALTFLTRNRAETRRIRALADYLEQVNTGKAPILSACGEDDFSKLEDEIYKTVTFLYQTKDAAVQAKNEFAENLANIAHQLKTPITSISLSLQLMAQQSDCRPPGQIEKQLLRLTRLEEALLLLSRLDAGVLPLRKDEVDVYTLLVLAADNLQELSDSRGVPISIPELEEMAVTADLEWTMEAVMNLMKNCIEHGKGGIVRCSCTRNPLYTEILIRDEGEGFPKVDIPHLFDRFYRGQNAKESGIGIGLALAKEIIERQNGTLRARNMPEGGACFEIRFYSH